MSCYTTCLESPLGLVRLFANEGALVRLDLDAGPPPPGAVERDDLPVLVEGKRQLAEYFAGERTAFELPLAAGGTEFQERVWAALVEIPFGETTSYGEIARRLGLPPGASRAVGAANGQNPIAIMVPCHRVIGANGALTGYAGGIEKKRWLLAHEAGARRSPLQLL